MFIRKETAYLLRYFSYTEPLRLIAGGRAAPASKWTHPKTSAHPQRCAAPSNNGLRRGNISRLPRHSISRNGQCVGNARGHQSKSNGQIHGRWPNQPQPGIKHMGHFPKATRAVAKGQNSLYLSNNSNINQSQCRSAKYRTRFIHWPLCTS